MITPDPVGPGFEWADHGFLGTSVQDGADMQLHIVGIF